MSFSLCFLKADRLSEGSVLKVRLNRDVVTPGAATFRCRCWRWIVQAGGQRWATVTGAVGPPVLVLCNRHHGGS